MKRELIAVKDEPDYARDPQSGAIININRSEIENARKAKKFRKQKLAEEANLKVKVDRLENDIGDIKTLLSQLVEKL
jgi:hypothetical protein